MVYIKPYMSVFDNFLKSECRIISRKSLRQSKTEKTEKQEKVVKACDQINCTFQSHIFVIFIFLHSMCVHIYYFSSHTLLYVSLFLLYISQSNHGNN